ncbi:hypothetical protein [Nocardia pseudobrasiliensis]|uniref:Uncharacterized protein n=1 Tax=Nocardia pseudobrasiliensis TaxID=45979 RepID=A0A370I8N0_9NOCA|nr:hypothetical protein [Nocardia pseudobrasiliensis]RDI67072.1 hypothetical protein DFR76_103143 [Nocardia pseudobrasiliensis]
MAGEVSVWVPIVVAGMGFAGVLGAQFVGSWREDRRRRRDRERHDDDRRYQARQDAHAQRLGAVEYWDATLHPIWQARIANAGVGAAAQTRLREAAEATTRTLGLVVLVAPERFRALIADVTVPRMRFAAAPLDDAVDAEQSRLDWRVCQDNYRRLRALMRVDLGFDAETAYLGESGSA